MRARRLVVTLRLVCVSNTEGSPLIKIENARNVKVKIILAKNLRIQGAGSPAAAEGRCSGCPRLQRPTTATGAVRTLQWPRSGCCVAKENLKLVKFFIFSN